MRQELGVRNVFHPIARLLNPARAASQVVGLTHPPHFEKTAEAIANPGPVDEHLLSGELKAIQNCPLAMTTKVLEFATSVLHR